MFEKFEHVFQFYCRAKLFPKEIILLSCHGTVVGHKHHGQSMMTSRVIRELLVVRFWVKKWWKWLLFPHIWIDRVENIDFFKVQFDVAFGSVLMKTMFLWLKAVTLDTNLCVQIEHEVENLCVLSITPGFAKLP